MKIIFEQAPYRITKDEKISKEAVELLHSTVYGTNGPLYQHIDAPEKISHAIRPLSFTLEKHEKTIGTCTFLERDITIKDKVYKGWYSRYFSIAQESQGKIFGNLLLKNIKNYFEQTTNTPTVFYGYVDNANPRSKRLLKHIGLEIIRNFETFAFSRVYPKKDKRVMRATEQDKQRILILLKKQYENYLFVNFEPLFLHDNYFVLKRKGEIVAGICANVTKWKVKHLPGISGKVLMKLLPYTPFISRIFNPNNFSFLGFEGMYCKPGSEKEFFLLMESVCAELQLHSGIIWIDPSSEFYSRIKEAGDWGLLNKLKDHIPANVFAAFRNIPENEQQKFREHPVYLSAVDLT